ncbi:unnamed protein product [Phaedon cochleariae]|uniref:Uncharacterized protein n=1 Tax=Phaedon cochleariae TaxID=80249 RepID=A0A9P0DTJ7_PHACE|nr:unnamed protein product [Phaedon cochleariae]
MDSEGVIPLNNSVFNSKMTNHTVVFYHFYLSPVSRAALLLTRALGIKHTVEVVNLLTREHMSPEFIKMNPLHTVPVLNDGGFIIYDSIVIMKYLANQYGKDDSLYPASPKKAALVDQRLFFSATYLFPRFRAFYTPTLIFGSPPDEENRTNLNEALQFLDTFLEGQKWVAGDNMTIADFSIITVIATIEAAGSIDLPSFSNVWSWYQRTKSAMESFGYEEVCQTGADAFGSAYKSKLK